MGTGKKNGAEEDPESEPDEETEAEEVKQSLLNLYNALLTLVSSFASIV